MPKLSPIDEHMFAVKYHNMHSIICGKKLINIEIVKNKLVPLFNTLIQLFIVDVASPKALPTIGTQLPSKNFKDLVPVPSIAKFTVIFILKNPINTVTNSPRIIFITFKKFMYKQNKLV